MERISWKKERIFEIGLQLLLAGRFDEACRLVKDVLKHQQSICDLYRTWANYFESHERIDLTVALLEKILDEQGGDAKLQGKIVQLRMKIAQERLNEFQDITQNRASHEDNIDVSIIIPVFNQLYYTQKCLESLYGTDINFAFEVIVVDNASSDGTREYAKVVQQIYPNFLYIRNRKNIFYGGACNVGARAARGKYLLFMNNDVEVLPDSLDALLRTFQKNKNVGIVGAKLLYPDGTIQHAGIEFRWRRMEQETVPWPIHRYRGVKSLHAAVTRSGPVPAVTGACLMVPRHVFDAVGGFDETYRMYFEDIELNLRVRKRGYTIWYEADSSLIHYEGKSASNQMDINKKNLESARIFYSRWSDFLKSELEDRSPISHELIWAAPIFNPSGYASEAIHFILGLDPYVKLHVIHDNPLVSKLFVGNLPEHWREVLIRCYHPDLQWLKKDDLQKYIVISHQPGHGLKYLPGAAYNIGRTMFETDRLPEGWLKPCMQMDEIWVPSEFNFDTFTRSGIPKEKIHIIPEAIDTDLFDPNIVKAVELPGKAKFNFLSVFEWSWRKGWDVLLDAYFRSFTSEDDVCLYLKTHLMNNYDMDTESVLWAKIQQFAEDRGYVFSKLPRIVLLTQQLSFEELLRLYRSVDAFVLPSRGEGWGRPYMEAMSMGLPVIGTRWSGNTAFMNEKNSYLIDIQGLTKVRTMEIPIYLGHRWANPSVEHLSELMRHLADHPEEARARGRKARADMKERFGIDAVARQVLDRLEAIEAQIASRRHPVHPISVPWRAVNEHEEPRVVDSGPPLQVVWEGDVFAYHSFALVNREIVARLMRAGHRVDVRRLMADQFHPEPESLLSIISQTAPPNHQNPEFWVRHTWPPNLEPPATGKWIVIQPWEYGSLPCEWVDVFSKMVDELWVPSEYVRDVYISSGVPAERVYVIPNGVDTKTFNPWIPPFPLKTKKSVKLLFVGGTIYRKGVDILLDAYLKAFRSQDDVCLVIKDFCTDTFYAHQNMKETIQEIVNRPDCPEIEYIDASLNEKELASLYVACDALVHPYRGEGFGLPIAEAMACGRLVVVPNGGPCLDFCNTENAMLVPARKVYFSESKIGSLQTVDRPWILEVEKEALIKALRWVVAFPEEARRMGLKGRQKIVDSFTWDHTAEKVVGRLEALRNLPPRRHAGAIWRILDKTESLVQEGRIGRALMLLLPLLETAPFPEVLFIIAKCHRERGAMDEAWKYLKHLIRCHPNYWPAFAMAAEMSEQEGKPGDAEKWWSAFSKLKPSELKALPVA